MKKIQIYKESLQTSIIVDEYDICTYINSFEIICKIGDIEITYNIPLNKDYKIIIEV